MRAPSSPGPRLLAALLAASAACATAPAGPRPAEEQERALVEAYFAAFNRHDLEAVVAFYAPDAVMVDPEHPGPVRGRAAIREHLRALFEEVPDVRDEVRQVVREPGRVAVEFVSTGTPRGAPAGFSVPIATFFTLEGGRIVRDATYYDRAR